MKLLLLAIRTLLRFRLYTIINIAGLALSLGSCILIGRYVHEQWMTDRFIPELDRVYLCTMEDEMTRRKNLNGISPTFGGDIFDILQEPTIERYAVYFNLEKDQITVNNKLCVANTLATDTNWLKIIPVPIIQATTEQLLEQPEDAAITASYAHKAPMAWWIFAAALSITACISFLTLIYQARKAARINPADIIRSE